MMVAQLLAAHNATMECYRRAMLKEQTFEGTRENLSQANKLSRTYAILLDALDRHRGKGQQKMTVEHVHIYRGGQAVAAVVESHQSSSGETKNVRQIAHAPQPTMRSADAEREPVPVPGDAERPLSDARRQVTGAPKGNKNALKHGRYSGEASARRRAVGELLRQMRALASTGRR